MNRFAFNSEPKSSNVLLEENGLRISLMTESLLRVELGAFCDEATQTVFNRSFAKVECSLEKSDEQIKVETASAQFILDLQGNMKSIILSDGRIVKDFEKGNLGGTARTLDMIDGAIKLNNGIMSRSGVAVLDDSTALIVRQNGEIAPREKCVDKYYFAYANRYRECLRDFYKLTGPTPLIPKYALGNWWSRYKAYTQEEYRSLMQKFISRKVPITVSVIDMDWHWTDVVKRFGKEARPKGRTALEKAYALINPGWTGYTWNTELFPDHCELLNWLHDNGLKVSLNVHPASGIRFYEKNYDKIAAQLGKNAEKKEVVAFEIAKPEFVRAYFDCIHHPLEDEGVDFWWIDWQQGTKTDTQGLDPLWALNHYHTLDNERKGKRGMILSRYAGLGSHRYPLGFSGDTFCSWKSLDFQPYFTNTATNAGYTWWSHDIGGHQQGVQDDELYVRWLQYGVFSPINRLHSSNNEFMGKEPWCRSVAARTISEDFLRLRHKLIPYLYSENYRTHTKGSALCEPMYYSHDREEAYNAKNQYMFGSELMVCPITEPSDKKLNLASCEVWLPKGRWTDIFTGRIYSGEQTVRMHRDLDSIPVLAHEGSIVPLYSEAENNDLSSNKPLEICVWRGNGSYELYEDDGESNEYLNGKFALINLEVKDDSKSITFTINAPNGDVSVLPEMRKISLNFKDISDGKLFVDGVEIKSEKHNEFTVDIEYSNKKTVITIVNYTAKTNVPRREALIELLTRVQTGNNYKALRFNSVLENEASLKKLPKYLRGAVEELDKLLYD